MGDDAVYDDRPGTYAFDMSGQTPGQALCGASYPLVWSR
jgi:hypothetical protein